MKRTPHRRERPSAVAGLLPLIVLILIGTAGACTTMSGPGVARSAAPPTALMDDPEADVALTRGEWDEAVRLHRALVEKQPGNGQAYYHLGYALGQLGKFSEEIAAYREAIKLGAREGGLYYNLGIALATAKEDYDGAVAAFQEGLRLTPDDPQLWYNLGTAYMSKGDFARAWDAFQAALQREPDFVDAWNNLAHALLGLGDRAGARAAWQEILAMDPGNLAAQMNLRSLDEKEGRGPGSNGRNPDLRQDGVH